MRPAGRTEKTPHCPCERSSAADERGTCAAAPGDAPAAAERSPLLLLLELFALNLLDLFLDFLTPALELRRLRIHVLHGFGHCRLQFLDRLDDFRITLRLHLLILLLQLLQPLQCVVVNTSIGLTICRNKAKRRGNTGGGHMVFAVDDSGPGIPDEISDASLPTLADVERRYMQHVLDKVDGNKKMAASILGIGRRTLYRRMPELQDADDADAL